MAKQVIKKNPVGRPTKYGPDILKKTEEYLSICKDGYERVLQSEKKRSVMYTHKFRVKLPTIGGLARYLHIRRETIWDWAKKIPEFSNVIGELMAEQEDRLINNGISGDYNPTIAKVLLTKHGYREGHEMANPDGSNLFRPTVEDQAAADRALRDMPG